MAAKRARTQRELAAAVGRSQPAVLKWIRHPTWPFGATGPWDVAAVKKWAAGLQEDRAADAAAPSNGGAAPQDLGLAQKVALAAKNENMLFTRAKREKLQGTLVSRELLDGALRGLARMFVAGLDELERSLPYQLAGRSAAEIEKIIAERIRAQRAQLAGQTVIELQQVEQRIAADALPKARGRPASRA